MVIAPDNEIVLLDVPIEIDNKNQLTFANSNTQFQYFRFVTTQKSYDHVTYVRKDGYVVINDCFDNLIKYNYCMYQNKNFSTKWFYAFIVKMEWLSPNSTKVFIKTDVWQTYQFDITFLSSFVEREHIAVANDTPGANLINEGLETGEYIENASSAIDGLNPNYVIAYGRNPNEGGVDSGTFTYPKGCYVNGIPSGLYYWVGHWPQLLVELAVINDAGFGDDIKAVFTVPSISVLGLANYSLATLENQNATVSSWVYSGLDSAGREFTLNSTPTSLDGYTPRNKKLLQYPFCYLGFTPSNGEQSIFRYEDFTSGTPSFKLICEMNPNPSPTFIPKNYKGITGVNVSEAVKCSGYPNISWTSDYFSGWMAQNSAIVNFNRERTEAEYQLGVGQAGINYMSGALNTSMGLVSGTGMGGGFLGSTANILYNTWAGRQRTDMEIQSQMLQVEKQKMLPNKSSIGTSAGILGYGYMNSDIFTRYTIKSQFAQRIDKYFDMYGYKTNTLKVPNLNNRPNWNYVKTIGLNIVQSTGASVPQEDLQEIKSIFDEGVTLWHNTSTFLDYSQNNR